MCIYIYTYIYIYYTYIYIYIIHIYIYIIHIDIHIDYGFLGKSCFLAVPNEHIKITGERHHPSERQHPGDFSPRRRHPEDDSTGPEMVWYYGAAMVFAGNLMRCIICMKYDICNFWYIYIYNVWCVCIYIYIWYPPRPTFWATLVVFTVFCLTVWPLKLRAFFGAQKLHFFLQCRSHSTIPVGDRIQDSRFKNSRLKAFGFSWSLSGIQRILNPKRLDWRSCFWVWYLESWIQKI